MTQAGIARIGRDDMGEGSLVAGVMDDLRGDLGPIRQAELRQIVLQEFRAPTDMTARELGTVGLLAIATAPQIADVVKQSQDDADHGTLGLELPECIDLPAATHEEA